MDKYIYDKAMVFGMNWWGNSLYSLPCLLPTEKRTQAYRLMGKRHKRYLQEHKRAVYITSHKRNLK